MNDLPQGWIDAFLTDIASSEKFAIVDGPFGSDLKLTDYTEDGSVPVLTTKNLNGKFDIKSIRCITQEKFEQLKRSKVIPGDILIAKIGSIGKSSIYPENAPVAIIPANLCKITVNNKVINNSYLLYQIKSEEFQNKLTGITSATAQPAFSVKRLKTLKIKLAPISEQQRIIAKLEELLAKVKASQERLNKIANIFKRFRQTVLAAACSGLLTADWRKDNPNITSALDNIQKLKGGVTVIIDASIPETWCRTELSVFINSMANGIYKPEKFYDSLGVACLRMYNIQNGRINWENIKRMILTEEEIDKYNLQDNDILINRVNSRELVGKAAVIKNLPENPVIFESKNIRLRLIEGAIIPEYVNYCFLTRIVRDVFEDTAKQTVGMATVSQPQIASLRLPIPPFPEQEEIVRRVEELFKIADRIKERYNKAKVQVDKLTQSILAKAFRGELVPQDPNDEPASALLERIKAEKESLRRKQ